MWTATTTTDRDRKGLLRALLEEVSLNLKRSEGRAHLTLRWRGGTFTTLDVAVPEFKPMEPHTDEDTHLTDSARGRALYRCSDRWNPESSGT
ncbi:MAG: hypothetical protein WBY44_24665 [Bryobacteraceae bacterium]